MAFSMGYSCGGTMALRRAGMQFASYPLDWTGAPGIVQGAKMIAGDFAGWLEKDDLQLVGVRGGSFQNNIYQSRRTRFAFPHDFPRFFRLDEQFPKVVEKYARRIRRFTAELTAAKTVLAVYVGRPIDDRLPNSDLVEAKRILEAKFPLVRFEVVFFYEEVGKKDYAEESVADGITAVACDYRQLDHGEVSHAILPEVLARYLVGRFEVEDRRSDEEKARYSREKEDSRRKKFAAGGTRLDRRLNELKYRLYRWLERDLQEKGLVPRDFPLWFD